LIKHRDGASPKHDYPKGNVRLSPTNFAYNHIGHFAAAGHATAKAIFLDGVTRRFPELRFAFLEGGVGWASQLFGDLIEHWSGAAPRPWSACTRASSTAPN
jgi:hypothetical protein